MSAPDLPRTDATVQELADAFTLLCLVITEAGRSAVRKVVLENAEKPGMRNLLKCMNDFERVNDWRLKNPEEAKRATGATP